MPNRSNNRLVASNGPRCGGRPVAGRGNAPLLTGNLASPQPATGRPPHPRRGFTLLEVMLAVAIIGLIAVSIFRFVDSTLRVVQSFSQTSGRDEELEALCRMLQTQLNDLPLSPIPVNAPVPGGVATSQDYNFVIQGQPHVFSGVSQDEISWRCMAGNGLFTAFAKGEYVSTLRLQEMKDGGKVKGMVLGIRRTLFKGDLNDFTWVPLVAGIKGMEIRYFSFGHSRDKWLEKWTAITRPNLVRIAFLREGETAPYEVVLTLPGVGVN